VIAALAALALVAFGFAALAWLADWPTKTFSEKDAPAPLERPRA
jgi:hypothetical protein